MRREGRCPRAKGDGKRVGVEATREMIARETETGRARNGALREKERAREGITGVAGPGLLGGLSPSPSPPWWGMTARCRGSDRTEEKKAAALLRGRIDRGKERAGESEVEIAGGVKCM